MGFLFKRNNTTNRADIIGDFQINSASYGETVPEVLGTTRVSGNIIYWDDFTAHEHKHTSRTGKGGGSKHTEIDYTYTVAAAIALCEGPIAGIGKVWKDKEVYEYPQADIQLSLYKGEYGQEPWPYVVSKHPEKALPYSGLAYMAGVVDLGNRGSLPTYNFEVKGKLLETGDGIDVNPADYILYVLKAAGIEDVKIEGIENFRKYCAAADILISTPPDESAKKAQQIINDIAEITNCYLFWSDDRLKIVPLADKAVGDWNPKKEIQYNLTADDLIPGSDGQLVIYKRKDSSETYNQATVEFINRSNGYEKETVSFEVVADVQKNGMKPASKKTAHYLYTKKRAQYYAEQLAMKRLYSKNQYTFHLDWAFCRLEPGDLVTLTDELCQLDRQVVVITAVNEAADGELEITAEGKPPGTYAPARYDVHENERPFTDYNVPAPGIDHYAIVQTPGDVSGNELLLGVTAPSGWGGCTVWVSDTGDSYKEAGKITAQARIGRLAAAMTAESTSCTVELFSGELRGGSAIDAQRGNTLIWIDGECLSYEGATLQPDGRYLLTDLVRGQYATIANNHAEDSQCVRIDEALFHAPYRTEDIGKKIWIKCASVNMFGSNEQDLAEVQAIEYTIQPYYIPEVRDLAVYTKYYDLGDGVSSFDVIATFAPPQITSFDTAEGWYKEGSGDWKYGGNGDGQIVISGCELGHTYDIRIRVKDRHGNYSQGLIKRLTVEMKSEVPNTPQGFAVTFGNAATFNWLEVRNADIDFYEIRHDLNPGQEIGRIGKSTNTTYVGTLTERTGRVYLYSHNPMKGYSAPAMLEYSVKAPKVPTHITAKGGMSGIGVTFDPVPLGCRGANVYVDDAVYFTPTNSFSLILAPGVYRVRVAYTDIFGEGEKSGEQLATVKLELDKSIISREALGLDEIDKNIAKIEAEVGTVKSDVTGLQTKLTQTAEGLQQSVTDLKTNVQTQLSQFSNSIDLRVSNAIKGLDGDGLISRINLSTSGVRIDGKLIHVTGQALFDDNIVTPKMIQAGAVTADKLQVESLDTISARIGTLRTATSGARTEIKDNLIEVYDANDKLRVRMGVW